MERIVVVPMQETGTALPIYSSSALQPVFAISPVVNSVYEVVELTDSNRYQIQSMVLTDIKSD